MMRILTAITIPMERGSAPAKIEALVGLISLFVI